MAPTQPAKVLCSQLGPPEAIIATLPAIAGLHAATGAEISLACPAAMRGVMAMVRSVGHVVALDTDPDRWMEQLGRVAETVDVAMNFAGHAGPLAAAMRRAPTHIQFVDLVDAGPPMWQRYVECVVRHGLPFTSEWPTVAFPSAGLVDSRQILAGLGVASDAECHVWAGLWSPVAMQWAESLGGVWVELVMEGDRATSPLPHTRPLSLTEAMALLSLAASCVTSRTAVGHLACLLGVPTVIATATPLWPHLPLGEWHAEVPASCGETELFAAWEQVLRARPLDE